MFRRSATCAGARRSGRTRREDFGVNGAQSPTDDVPEAGDAKECVYCGTVRRNQDKYDCKDGRIHTFEGCADATGDPLHRKGKFSMGSHLYISIDVRHPNTPGRDSKYWGSLFDGPSQALARGSVVDAFGGEPDLTGDGYLTRDEWMKQAKHPECPWRLDEPYWVRMILGPEFVAIIREKRWQKLQDGNDLECRAELRAFAAAVESLLSEGCDVEVYCWHSQ